MTTALDLIKRSLRLLGVYSTDEEPSADESADALAVLNDLVAELSNTGLVHVKTLDSIALSAGVPSITVGPSGTTVTSRPAEVLNETHIDIGVISYPLRIITLNEYAAIEDKATQGTPEAAVVLMNMPDVQLTFWPVPSASATLKLWSNKVFASFPALTTTVSLPPGYNNALANLLAEALAAEYETPIPAAVAVAADRARRTLEEKNFQPPVLRMPADLSGVAFNILTGDAR